MEIRSQMNGSPPIFGTVLPRKHSGRVSAELEPTTELASQPQRSRAVVSIANLAPVALPRRMPADRRPPKRCQPAKFCARVQGAQ